MFFALWDENLSHFESEPRFQNILIECHVYFAIFPLLSLNQEYKAAETMKAFKKFLDTRGHSFCFSQSNLQYYALPYVPNPQTNDHFKHLFLPKWREELIDRLKLVASKIIKKQRYPKLLELISRPVCFKTC